MTNLIRSTEANLVRIIESAFTAAAESKSASTRTAYQSDWTLFESFCARHGLVSKPADPSTVALFITHQVDSGRAIATVVRELAAIAQAHKLAGHLTPVDARVREVLKGLRRRVGSAQTQKAPAVVDDLLAMIDTLDDSPIGLRDRAMLLVGFAGAFRRSELVALDVEDLSFTNEGLVIHLRRSKTDQLGLGRKVGIPFGRNETTCPVRTLRQWLEAAGITNGAIFRFVDSAGRLHERSTDRTVARVVKRCAEAAGLDASKFSGHSLRAGLATSAAMAGKSERTIMNQTGHRSERMVRRYIRDANLFRDNAAGGLL